MDKRLNIANYSRKLSLVAASIKLRAAAEE